MDWTRLLKTTARIVRSSRALWWLGAISAAQAGMLALVIGGLVLPLTLLTQLLVQARIGAESPSSPSPGTQDLATQLSGIVNWLQHNETMLFVVIVMALLLWLVVGIFDVAATAGAIMQASRVAEGGEGSAPDGLRDGFAIWWRTVGLLAIAALPQLSYLLVLALVTLFTISIPIASGGTPDVLVMQSGNLANSLFSMVASVLGIPLGVLVQIGLRYAVIEGQPWREAFGSAWGLAKVRFADVAIMYLMQVGISLGAAIALMIALGLVLLVSGLLGFAGAGIGLVPVAIALGGTLALLVIFVFSATLFVWFSTMWTLFWRDLTGRDGVVSPAGPKDSVGPANEIAQAPGSWGASAVRTPL